MTTLMPLQPLSTNATLPSITIVQPFQAYTGEKLNKLKVNYRHWHMTFS